MRVPRWFESTLLEAQSTDTDVDFGHLGEQMALRIEEVVPPRAVKDWFELTQGWSEPSSSLGDSDGKVLEFLEHQSSGLLDRIPGDKRPEFLHGVWKKRDS